MRSRRAAGLDELIGSGMLDGVDEDTIRAVIEEAGKFGAEVLDPLSAPGDRAGSKLVDGKVVTPPGWKEAYQQFAAGGWGALPAPEEWGGQNLPQVVATAAGEIWNSANLAFGLCPLLTFGAIDAIEAQGSEELKTHLPAEDGVGRMDRHHEPDRAARRLRPRRAQDHAP